EGGLAEPRRPLVAGAVAPGPVDVPRRGERARSSRPPTRERGLGRDRDRPGPRAVPPIARRTRRITAHSARVPHRRRRLPRLAGGTWHGLAGTHPDRPARVSRRPR